MNSTVNRCIRCVISPRFLTHTFYYTGTSESSSPHTRVSVRVGTSQRSDPPRGLAPALHALQLPTRLLCIRDCAEMSHHVSHWSRFVASRLASHAAAAASSNPPCSLASARSALRTSRGIAPEAPAMYTWQ